MDSAAVPYSSALGHAILKPGSPPSRASAGGLAIADFSKLRGLTHDIPPSEIDVREEIDIVSLDPLFIERQRNRYASRAVAYVVWLNGLAALAILLGLAHATIPPDNVKRFADAMLVFGAGAVAGLGSAFFAYLGRTFRIERPYLASWRRPLRWCAILAAIAGAVCFIGALNMARVAVLPKEAPAAPSTAAPQPEKPTPGTPNP